MATSTFRYRPGYDPRTKEYIGLKPRPSRAKEKKRRTCPICAETFTASRSDQTYCSSTCRSRAYTGVIPEAVAEKAAETRQKRAEANAKARATRAANKEHKERLAEERRKAIEETALLREKWIAAMEADGNSTPEDFERAKTVHPLPEFVYRFWGDEK